jgi:hypothetical protein
MRHEHAIADTPEHAACDHSGSPAKASHKALAQPYLQAWAKAQTGVKVERPSGGRATQTRTADVARFKRFADIFGQMYRLARQDEAEPAQPPKRIDPLVRDVMAVLAKTAAWKRIGPDLDDEPDLIVAVARHYRTGKVTLRLTLKNKTPQAVILATEGAREAGKKHGLRIAFADCWQAAAPGYKRGCVIALQMDAAPNPAPAL